MWYQSKSETIFPDLNLRINIEICSISNYFIETTPAYLTFGNLTTPSAGSKSIGLTAIALQKNLLLIILLNFMQEMNRVFIWSAHALGQEIKHKTK